MRIKHLPIEAAVWGLVREHEPEAPPRERPANVVSIAEFVASNQRNLRGGAEHG